MCQEALDMERSHGKERVEGKCRKDKGHDLWSGLDLLQSSGEYPCAVCRPGVGNNSIYCNGCKLWVHKKCSRLQWLTPNPDFRCAQCMGNPGPIDCRPQSEVQVGLDLISSQSSPEISLWIHCVDEKNVGQDQLASSEARSSGSTLLS